jgi:hypothetical protein
LYGKIEFFCHLVSKCNCFLLFLEKIEGIFWKSALDGMFNLTSLHLTILVKLPNGPYGSVWMYDKVKYGKVKYGEVKHQIKRK